MPQQAIDSQHDVLAVAVRPGKWTVTVLELLSVQTLRFSEIRRQAGGVSQKTLTTTLRDLERDGFVTRTVFVTIPPRVDYELTDIGRELLKLAEVWRRFAERNSQAILSSRQKFDLSSGASTVRTLHRN